MMYEKGNSGPPELSKNECALRKDRLERITGRLQELETVYETDGFAAVAEYVNQQRSPYLGEGGTSKAYEAWHNDQQLVLRLPNPYGGVYHRKSVEQATAERAIALLIGSEVEDFEHPVAFCLKKHHIFTTYQPGLKVTHLGWSMVSRIKDESFVHAFTSINHAHRLGLEIDTRNYENFIFDGQRFKFVDYQLQGVGEQNAQTQSPSAKRDAYLFLSMLSTVGMRQVDMSDQPQLVGLNWQSRLQKGVQVFKEMFSVDQQESQKLTRLHEDIIQGY